MTTLKCRAFCSVGVALIPGSGFCSMRCVSCQRAGVQTRVSLSDTPTAPTPRRQALQQPPLNQVQALGQNRRARPSARPRRSLLDGALPQL
jgi:hypothetical protein